jgi:hypothetical protein
MKSVKLEEMLNDLLDDRFKDTGSQELGKKNVGLVLTEEYYEKMRKYYGRNVSKIVDEFLRATVDEIESRVRQQKKSS